MENNKHNSNNDWYKQCLTSCEDVGISKTIIHMFIHFQERKYEQDNKKKLRIPGYETKVIIKAKDNQTKPVDGVQLSLYIDTELESSSKD